MPASQSSRRLFVASLLIGTVLTSSSCSHSAPQTFVRSADQSGVWKSIELAETSDKARLWSTTVDALTTKYDIEVLDRDSGYLRTTWKFTTVEAGNVDRNYRTRFIAKFNNSWTVLQVKSEAEWLYSGNWVTGYDSKTLEDVYGDLQGRLGRTRK